MGYRQIGSRALFAGDLPARDGPHGQSSLTTEQAGRTAQAPIAPARLALSGSELPALSVPGVRTAVQRAHRHGAQPSPGSHRHRVPGRAVETTVQVEPAWVIPSPSISFCRRLLTSGSGV
jgi:hypothetical protein